jgi:two-component system response regulator HydG
MNGHVLIVDDEPGEVRRTAKRLESRGHAVTTAHELGEGLARVDELRVDVVLTGLDVNGASGLELCARVVDEHPDLPVILLTAHGTLDAAVQALRAGAFDFLTSPIDEDQLHHRIQRALTHRELVTEVKRLRRVSEHAPGIAEIIGESMP